MMSVEDLARCFVADRPGLTFESFEAQLEEHYLDDIEDLLFIEDAGVSSIQVIDSIIDVLLNRIPTATVIQL